MKFEETEKSAAYSDHCEQEKNTLVPEKKMEAVGQEPSDIFQAELYNSGKVLLEKLSRVEGDSLNAQKSYQELLEKMKQLRDFHFNIGFAGGMSSGKSTVINSLIEYPLMPTCKLTTTCVGTHMFYGEHPRICVVDNDTGKQVLNVDCTNISDQHFRKLKEYACITTHVKVIENLQHFTGHNLFEDKDSVVPEMLDMDKNDPNHVIVLLLILLTVYVDQNSVEMNHKTRLANQKRKEVLDFFNFDPKTINYTIQLQWNGDFLKSGMTITDLPGLGAYAPDKELEDGTIMNGHDTITKDAIKKTDAMVFLVDPQVDAAGLPALQVMITNAQMKEIVNRNDLVIPILNKVDTCQGKAVVDAAVDKFVDILRNTGVEKTREDIHLYSAIYGECKYADFPIERKCFYFWNADKHHNLLRKMPMFKNCSDEQLSAMANMNIEAELNDAYEHSGIEALKLFFRASYISKSKNRRAQAAVLALTTLASDLIGPKKALLKNYSILRNVAGLAITDISKGLKSSVDAPIGEALNKITGIDHMDYYVREKLEDIPEAYAMAFQNALNEYKKRNLGIIGKFELAFLSFSDNARIDQLGSFNHSNYNTLCEEMGKMGIDIAGVNKKFSSVLRHVTNETESMYINALRVLRELKKSIPSALDGYVAQYSKAENNNDRILNTVRALRDALVEYMEQQIDIIEASMKVNESNLARAGNEIVANIMDLNSRIVSLYTNSILGDIRKAHSNGIWFTSREYIKINGTGGLKETFSNLTLSKDDRAYIEKEVETIGIAGISNNLDSWYQDTENIITGNFVNLREQLQSMMDKTVAQLSGDEKQIAKNCEDVQKMLDDLQEAFGQIRESVQAHYSASVEGISDDTLNRYKQNIFDGIME